MKKVLAGLLAGTMILALAGCSGAGEKEAPKEAEGAAAEGEELFIGLSMPHLQRKDGVLIQSLLKNIAKKKELNL